MTRRLCCRRLKKGSGKFRKKRRTLPSWNRRAMSTDMLANTLRTLAGPPAAHRGVDRVDQLAPDLHADERGRPVVARPVDQEVGLRRPQLDLQRAPGLDLDPRDVRDVEQVRLERVDVLADAHGGRRQPRPSAWRELSASSSRNTAAGAAAACAPASAASMTSVGMRIAAATISVGTP